MRDFDMKEAQMGALGVRVAQAMGGAVSTGQLSVAPPPPTGSLSDALNQLSNAIAHNGGLIGNTQDSLERIGVIRPSYPTPDGGTSPQKIAQEPSQLAAALMSLVRMLEQNNQRLADVFNRLDS